MRSAIVKLSFAAFALLLAGACNEPDQPYLRLSVDGTQWTANNDLTSLVDENDMLDIYGYTDATETDFVRMRFESITDTGTYLMDTLDGQLWIRRGTESYYIDSNSGTGSLFLSFRQLTQTSPYYGIKGTFSGTAVSEDEADTLVITGGEFGF